LIRVQNSFIVQSLTFIGVNNILPLFVFVINGQDIKNTQNKKSQINKSYMLHKLIKNTRVNKHPTAAIFYDFIIIWGKMAVTS